MRLGLGVMMQTDPEEKAPETEVHDASRSGIQSRRVMSKHHFVEQTAWQVLSKERLISEDSGMCDREVLGSEGKRKDLD